MSDLPQVSFHFNNQGSAIEVQAYSFDGDPLKKFSVSEWTHAPDWFGRVFFHDTWEDVIGRAKERTTRKVLADVVQYRKSSKVVEAQYNG